MTIPSTSIGGLEVSRLMCGSNPFFGYSHFSKARDLWQKEYFTRERIVAVIAKCTEFGMNAVMGPPLEELHQAIVAARDVTGREIIWVCTPWGGKPGELENGIAWCAERGASICMPHSAWVDSHHVSSEKRIEGLERYVQLIRSFGMIPGLSTHRPETLVSGEAAGYDIETYILPHNVTGFLLQVETDWNARVIRECPKPVMVIKPLAAGRIAPDAGLPFVYRSIKPIDTVCLGFTSPHEVEEDVTIILQALEGQPASVPLSTTRSKAPLTKPGPS